MPLKIKSWRVTLLAVAITATALLALGAIIYHYHLKSKVEQYQAELKAKGYVFEVSQLRPPPVPMNEDRSGALNRAISLLSRDSWTMDRYFASPMQMIAPGKAMVGARQAQIYIDSTTYSKGTTISWEEVEGVIISNKVALESLNQMTEHSKVDCHIQYEMGLGHPDDIPRVSLALKFLGSALMLDLHLGDPNAACEKNHVALAICEAMGNHRRRSVELTRIAVEGCAQTMTWEILQSGKASDEALIVLQRDWERQDFIRDYQNILAMELACARITLEECRDSEVVSARYAGGVFVEPEGGFANLRREVFFPARLFIWRYWFSYAEELLALQGVEAAAEAGSYAQTNGAFGRALKQQQVRFENLGLPHFDDSDRLSLLKSLLSESIDSGRLLKRVALAETSKQLTITAIALKRYELAHGKYPASLSELSPAYVQSVPLDPIDAKPLRYKLNPDGTFSLYSIGEDGVDDGGNPENANKNSSLSWRYGRDWLWPQPATPDEVRQWLNNLGRKK